MFSLVLFSNIYPIFKNILLKKLSLNSKYDSLGKGKMFIVLVFTRSFGIHFIFTPPFVFRKDWKTQNVFIRFVAFWSFVFFRFVDFRKTKAYFFEILFPLPTGISSLCWNSENFGRIIIVKRQKSRQSGTNLHFVCVEIIIRLLHTYYGYKGDMIYENNK